MKRSELLFQLEGITEPEKPPVEPRRRRWWLIVLLLLIVSGCANCPKAPNCSVRDWRASNRFAQFNWTVSVQLGDQREQEGEELRSQLPPLTKGD